MKLKLFAGAALALVCIAVSGCISPGLPDMATASTAASATASSPAANLDILKEVNHHVELCHRTYTLGWPFSGIVDCPAQTPPAAAPLSAADIAAMIDSAVTKAVAAVTPPATPKP